MGLGEELLNSVTDGTEEEVLLDGNIIVGADRFITVPENVKKIAVQYDHDVTTVTFDCPRYWDGHDLSTMRVYINYMRADGVLGACLCDNVTIDTADSNIMHFDWTISGHVTYVTGNISFLVCVKNVDADGGEINHWNSELNTDLYVTEGLECQETVLRKYPDIITQLLIRMDATEERIQNGLDEITEFKGQISTEVDEFEFNVTRAMQEHVATVDERVTTFETEITADNESFKNELSADNEQFKSELSADNQAFKENIISSGVHYHENKDVLDGITKIDDTLSEAGQPADAKKTGEEISAAKTAAGDAKTTADEAVTKAGNAQSTADEAVTKAGNAQSTADNAVTAAGNAQSTADQAVRDAAAANTAANNAQNTANSKASTATYTVNVPVSWIESEAGGFTQTVNVAGMLETDNPIADIILGADVEANMLYLEAWDLITRITTANGSITIYANADAPVTAFTIQLKVVR